MPGAGKFVLHFDRVFSYQDETVNYWHGTGFVYLNPHVSQVGIGSHGMYVNNLKTPSGRRGFLLGPKPVEGIRLFWMSEIGSIFATW